MGNTCLLAGASDGTFQGDGTCRKRVMLNAFVPQPLRPLHPCRPACLLPRQALLSGHHPHPPPPGWSASDAWASTDFAAGWFVSGNTSDPRLRYLPPHSSSRPQTPTSRFQGVLPDSPLPPLRSALVPTRLSHGLPGDPGPWSQSTSNCAACNTRGVRLPLLKLVL